MRNLETAAAQVDLAAAGFYEGLAPIELANHRKVLEAFHEAGVSSYHLGESTGYGYDDDGRDTLEAVFAKVFGAERALVRGQIVSGTHAIALCLYGILRPGDLLVTVQGKPYDTLDKVIGVRWEADGSLAQLGVRYREVELLPDGGMDWQSLDQILRQRVKMILVQRSSGYSRRAALDMAGLRRLCAFVKERQPDTVILVDNCYGEFVEASEPTENGADIIAGSLIKNPGGGLAPTGGYVAGADKLVRMAANRLTAPGLGAGVGPSLGWLRLFYQGLYLAPHLVMEALRGAIWGALFFRKLGYEVYPAPEAPRTDIIQAVVMGSPERLEAFCRCIQAVSPVDSHVTPIPSTLPGYEHPVIMAAGTFVQGASLEFTADAPVREPYAVYFQGGLSLYYTKMGFIRVAEAIKRNGW
ncbi:MAG: methionine gamma-lyase family protein [Firmicutes bacterium]|nr:methionine gamma-lyase family protein [Bacillota bacterium]